MHNLPVKPGELQRISFLFRPMSFSQVAALLPSRLSSRSHVSGSLSFIRCPALSLSHAPFIPLRVNAFRSAGYLGQTQPRRVLKWTQDRPKDSPVVKLPVRLCDDSYINTDLRPDLTTPFPPASLLRCLLFYFPTI